VPTGHVWVEGDEQFHSRDSNRWGPVSAGLVEARVTRIVWPLRRAGVVETTDSGEKRWRDPRVSSSPMKADPLVDEFWRFDKNK